MSRTSGRLWRLHRNTCAAHPQRSAGDLLGSVWLEAFGRRLLLLRTEPPVAVWARLLDLRLCQEMCPKHSSSLTHSLEQAGHSERDVPHQENI